MWAYGTPHHHQATQPARCIRSVRFYVRIALWDSFFLLLFLCGTHGKRLDLDTRSCMCVYVLVHGMAWYNIIMRYEAVMMVHTNIL